MHSMIVRILRSCLMSLVTPLLEKNPAKTLGLDIPVVFSMSRSIVLAFAVGVLHQMWHTGIGGWPEATLAMAIVLALPVMGALDRVKPQDVVTLASTLIGRFGVGDIGAAPAPASAEPSKYDDHRSDAAQEAA